MDTGKTRMLVVEDNQDDEELMMLVFEDMNIAHRIDVVRDGVEALDYLFCRGAYADRNVKEQPSAILLDLKLPKLDGIQVLAKVKTDEVTRHIPVVILTSSREGPDIEKCYAFGVNSYIVKPIDTEQFVNAIKQLGIYWFKLNEPHP